MIRSVCSLLLSFSIIAAIFTTTSCSSSEENEGRPPNIVMILGDDHSYLDSGFMGSEHVQTPRLDRLADEGVVFPITYNTASICLPSQISLLTGLDPSQWRAELLRRTTLGLETRQGRRVGNFATLPRVLSRLGDT